MRSNLRSRSIRSAVPAVAAIVGLALVSAGACEVSTGAPAPSPAVSGDSTDGPVGEPAEVVRVLDGDTVEVRIDGALERVRLLGVDTPERGRGGRPAEALSAEATRFVQRHAGGAVVRLVADDRADDRDAYDRLLRYVVLADGSMLNERLILEGLGVALTRWPYARSDAHVEAERQARREGRGLWSPDRVRSVDAENAAEHVGEVVSVEGDIVDARCLSSVCFLDFDRDFRRHVAVVILGPDRHRFPEDPVTAYRGRSVRVVGRVTRFARRDQILVRAPDQITDLTNRARDPDPR